MPTNLRARWNRWVASLAATLVVAAGLVTVPMIVAPTAAEAALPSNVTQLACTPGTIYSLTNRGVLYQVTENGNTFDVTNVGRAFDAFNETTNTGNGLGMTPDGKTLFGFSRPTGASTAQVVRYTLPTAAAPAGVQTTVASGINVSAASLYMVAGAYDPLNKAYYFGGPGTVGGVTSYYLWRYDTVAGTMSTKVITAPAGSNFTLLPGNGDIAFDAAGNLFVVLSGTTTNNLPTMLLTVTAASLASATPQFEPLGVKLANAGTGQQYNGIAFDGDGALYVQFTTNTDVTNIRKIEPNTGAESTSFTGTGPSPDAGVTRGGDLASCSVPGTLKVKKDIVSRKVSTDQFSTLIETTAGGIDLAKATTSGATTGLQAAVAGPAVMVTGSKYTISETYANGSAISDADYYTTWVCTSGVTDLNGNSSGVGRKVDLAAYPAPALGASGGVVSDCTFTNIARQPVVATKSVSASATPVVAGTTLTYTLTFNNSANAAAPGLVNHTDYLADVIDDADFGSITSTSAGLTANYDPATKTIVTTGEVPAAGTSTVTYTVTVKAPDLRGNSVATNFLVPSGTPPPTTCVPSTNTCTTTPIRSYSVSKTADATTLVPGQTITYTLKVKNTGAYAYTATDGVLATDNLSSVLDDGTIVGTPAVAPAGTGTASITGNTLSYTGPLPIGATATITYQVKVGTPPAGDGILKNAVTPTKPEATCDDTVGCITTAPVGSYSVSKKADKTTAALGDVVTYTVTVKNTGKIDYVDGINPASFSDGLTDVLNNAAMEAGSPSATGGTASVTGNTLAWSGSLAQGASVTVTYKVKVTATGDLVMKNVVTPTGTGGQCVTGECTTTTDIPAFTVEKKVDKTTAANNEKVTYTIVVKNKSKVAYAAPSLAAFTDDLAAVLDVATYNNDVTATGGSASVTGSTLSWSGALAPAGSAGDTVTITYSVQTKVGGDNKLNNGVTPGTGGECLTATSCTTETILKAFTVKKTADKTSVKPGDTLKYDIVVTNTGGADFTAAAPATFSDDLSDVLDDANFNAGSLTPAGSASLTGTTLSWSGALAAGASVTVSYTVTVKNPLPTTANGILKNAVTPGTNGGCTDPGDCTTTTPTSSFTVEKLTDKQATYIGDEITYSIVVRNTGKTAYDGLTTETTAAFSDDLTSVLDNGTIVGTPTASAGAVDLTGNTLKWSGALAAQGQPGATVTITYTVKVATAGDLKLVNTVTPTGPGGSCVAAASCTTTTPIAAFTVEKTVDPTVANAGDVLTYTVTVKNASAVAFTAANPASFSDDLTAVLDDADFVAITAPASGASFDPATKKLTWSGALAATTGTATITYTVKTKTGGNMTATNVVTPGSGGTCETTGSCTTTTLLRAYTVQKEADVASVKPGDVVTYTITVTNTGTAPYDASTPVSISDDLAAVLDDATYETNSVTASAGTASIDLTTKKVIWSGPLTDAAPVTITYKVKVNATNTGNGTLVNVVTPTGPGGECVPGECTTTTPMSSYTVEKSADSQVAYIGDEIMYTVTVKNTGQTAYDAATPASFTDSLANVLDNGTIDAASITASAGTASLVGNTLTWNGPLAVVGSVVVSYKVKVTTAGDLSLVNNVTPTGPGGSCLTVGGCTTTTPIAAFTVTKTVDKTAVTAGEDLQYTVTVTNTSTVPFTAADPASFEDDLTAVLDDATFTAIDQPATGASFDNTSKKLTWSGALAAGASLEVKYTVTTKTGGNLSATNTVTPGTGGTCEPVGSCTTTTPLRAFTVKKAADLASVKPGDTLTYTITVTNRGQAAYDATNPASITDSLAAVLDDADFGTVVSASAGTATFDSATGTLSWSGPLDNAAPVTIVYTVIVKDPNPGDGLLTNAVVPDGPDGSCVEADDCTTTTPMSSYTVEKTVDKQATYVNGEVTYTVVVRNTGKTAYDGLTDPTTASFTDDLSNVLDNGTLVGSPAVTAGSATVDANNVLTWNGPLAQNGTVTVTYTVKVGTLGDALLGNGVTPTGPGGTCVADMCETETPIAHFVSSKSVDKTVVSKGGTVTYTITVTNDGSVAFTNANMASILDDLSGVLDDGAIEGTPSASAADGSPVPAPTVDETDETLAWAGPIAVGGVITITYQVKVDGDGDRTLGNTVTSGPGGSCETADGCTTSTPMRAFTVAKSASVPNALPGDPVTYTITVTNTGTADYTDAEPASIVDDLTGVLDDGTNVTSTTPGVVIDLPGKKLTWQGALLQGTPVVITYTVTATDAAAVVPNDRTLKNSVKPGEVTPGGECTANCSTETPIGSYKVEKTTDVSTVRPDGTVEYTLTVTNTGKVAYTDARPATIEDDLTDVIAFATFNDDATADSGTTTWSSPKLTWSGALAIDESIKITYTATVDKRVADGSKLKNVVVPTAPGGVCEAADDCTTETPIQQFTVLKGVDKTEVVAGETVEYTITITNGDVAYTDAKPASLTDDLSDVLDDGVYADDAVASSGTVSYSEPELSWEGAMTPGQVVTITYSIHVNAPRTPDGTMINTVVTPPGSGGNCDPALADPDCTATVDKRSFIVSKVVSSTTAIPGDTVTYTITVTNDGKLDYTNDDPASIVDDLSRVLDDGTIVPNSVTADSGTPGIAAGSTDLTWSGALTVGQVVEISYQVKLSDPAPASSDGTLHNKVRPTAPGGECDPTPGMVCETITKAAAYAVEKSSSPAVANPGTPVTYTVTVKNTGGVAYPADAPASLSDDLSDVLDDATLTSGPTVSRGTTDASITGNTLAWTGELGATETLTIEYVVTVNALGTGDKTLRNVVTPTGPGGECVPGECVTTTPVQSFRVQKSSAPAVTNAGGTVTYTITVTNTGEVPYTEDAPASITDDLSGVLAVADYNGDVDQGATVKDGILSWSGALGEEPVTITYSVKVKTGLASYPSLTNVVVPGNPGGECVPGECVTTTPVRAYTVAKQASAASVQPGEQLTYTVTVTSTGSADYVDPDFATFTDDLSGVLDDAAWVSVDNADATFDADAKTLTWTGAVATGTPVVITYVVAVNAPITGDQKLTNVVVPDGPGGECTVDCETETPIASYTVSKTASVASALPGDVVTYTVTVTNTGEVDYTADLPASFTDDLAAVLDDATYNGDATAGAAVDGSTLSWSGALPVGAPLVVTYSVTVNDPISGDQKLTNVVVPNGPGGTCTENCETETPVASYTVNKTVSVASARPGDTVEYTLTVKNTGQVAYDAARPATISDDLSQVTDDATYNGDVTSGATVTGSTLDWSGALAIGETVTITYSVTVNDPRTGDSIMTNTVVPGTPGGGCETDCTTTTPVQSFRVVKTSTPKVTKPGDVVDYTITVTNTGELAYSADDPASFTDDMSDVLDDATYDGDVAADSGTVSYAAPVLSWNGALEIGQTVTITYSVKVNDPITGDKLFANVAVTPPKSGGNCVEGSGDPDCGTDGRTTSFSVEKQVDKGEAMPGDTVTYTILVKNTSDADITDKFPASIADTLTSVLDDATYNGDATSGAVVKGDELTWSGPIPVGGTVAITYSVTVNDPVTGDSLLTNRVRPTAPGGTCPVDMTGARLAATCVTETPIGGYSVEKQVGAKTAFASQKVTYTITVRNTGLVAYTDAVPASLRDDLSDVLDDATYNDDASSGAVVKDGVLTWAGPLAVGGEQRITYSVTVAAPNVGDMWMRNAVVPTGPGGVCGGDCDTETPISAIKVVKKTDRAEVQPGDVVKYTLTVSNIGKATVDPLVITDDMSGVLAYAKFNNDATAGATLDGNILSWTGALEPGDVQIITYSVTVGNHPGMQLRNVVTGGGVTNCEIGVDPDCRTTTPIIPPLAVTGTQIAGGVIGLGLAAVLAGGVLLLIRRRRQEKIA